MKVCLSLSVIFCLWLGGFVVYVKDAEIFAEITKQYHIHKPKADLIVVLTGGRQRIKKGITLLKNHYAPQLLISGVNEEFSKGDVIRLSGFKGSINHRAIDIDYRSQSTIGNANHTKAWIEASPHKIKSLFLVTSSYHMRRSCLEFERLDPRIKIYPYAINPLAPGMGPWSKSQKMLSLYMTEYMKYLGAFIRFKMLCLYKKF